LSDGVWYLGQLQASGQIRKVFFVASDEKTGAIPKSKGRIVLTVGNNQYEHFDESINLLGLLSANKQGFSLETKKLLNIFSTHQPVTGLTVSVNDKLKLTQSKNRKKNQLHLGQIINGDYENVGKISPLQFNIVYHLDKLKNTPKSRKSAQEIVDAGGISTSSRSVTNRISGCSITAKKTKKVQKNGNIHHYVHYHCTKKREKCSQPFTNVIKLEKQYKSILSRIKVPQAFHEWALEEIKLDQQKEVRDRGQSLERARKGYDDLLEDMDNLIEKYLDGKVPEDYYNRKLAEYEKNKKIRKKVLDSIDQRVDERLQEIDDDLGFAVTARQKFEDGDDFKRREIISRLGSNLIITNHSLDIELKKPLKMIEEIAEEINVVVKRFEPLENVDNSAKFKEYLSENPTMGS
jgi:hypothetical protein